MNFDARSPGANAPNTKPKGFVATTTTSSGTTSARPTVRLGKLKVRGAKRIVQPQLPLRHYPVNEPTGHMISMSELERMAQAVARSKLFGIETADQALALMAIAAAEGLHPGIVARDYHIIKGRPSLKADAMLARYQHSGGSIKFLKYTDEEVSAVFSHPKGGELEISWTIERARHAGLTERDNWRQYPRQMLRARVISEGIRATFPAVAVGIYTPEEVQDMVQDEPRTVQAEDPRGAEYAGQPTATQPPEQGRLIVDHDTGEVTSQAPPPPNAAPPARQTQPGWRVDEKTGVRLISEGQMTLVRNKVHEKGLAKDEVLAHFKIDRLGDLPFARVNELLDWIAKKPGIEDVDIPF